jgi:DinB superfamily
VSAATDALPAVRPRGVASALLRRQFRLGHTLLEAAIAGLTAEAVHRHPPGVAAPPEARYARVVLCEDLTVNGVLAAGPPLALSTWAGRTGLSELPPLGRPTAWRAWARRVRLDLAEFRPYARAVYAATDAYLDGLPDEALDPARNDLRVCLLSALLLTVSMRHGEIACLLAHERRPYAEEAKG